ncbi:MAG TPA: hypothetical protein VFY84_19200 [Jiangellales bacterium]|nr:hypothetical protein [Jiangellales bacterium]
MTSIKVDVEGGRDWGAALRIKGAAVTAATRYATAEAGREVKRGMVRRLTMRRHPPGTPTPAPPGGPPAAVSGKLADSVAVGTVRRGFGRGVYEVIVAPHRVYARIQQQGGRTGRNHATVLPARPYLKPRTRAEMESVKRIYLRAWREAIKA